MNSGPQARLLPDGRRLHLQHGPIDLVVQAWGGRIEAADGRGLSDPVRDAYRAATARFATILAELCDELPALRRPVGAKNERLRGVVAGRMRAAVLPFGQETFITPMAAVAGAVAEEILRAMTAAAPLGRACVNNGGDIALHLVPGESFDIGLVDRPDRPRLIGTARIRVEGGVSGVATSGWRGRSFSLGIADAVTILARTAPEADAAATVVANAVDLPGHPAVTRAPADSIQQDSDLGARPVTRAVAALAPGEVAEALARGLACAEALVRRGAIVAAALHLREETRLTEHAAFRGTRSPSAAILQTTGGDMASVARSRSSPPPGFEGVGQPSSVVPPRVRPGWRAIPIRSDTTATRRGTG